MNHVRVTNNTDQDISGRYDGVDYVFASKSSQDVPSVVASHVFAFGNADKSAALARLGWLVTSDQRGAALEKLGQIKFEAIEMVGRPIEDEESAPTVAMVPDRIGASSSASPRVHGVFTDGKSGGDLSPPGEPLGVEPDTI
jgi:hypothetical protein